MQSKNYCRMNGLTKDVMVAWGLSVLEENSSDEKSNYKSGDESGKSMLKEIKFVSLEAATAVNLCTRALACVRAHARVFRLCLQTLGFRLFIPIAIWFPHHNRQETNQHCFEHMANIFQRAWILLYLTCYIILPHIDNIDARILRKTYRKRERKRGRVAMDHGPAAAWCNSHNLQRISIDIRCVLNCQIFAPFKDYQRFLLY